MMTRWRRTGRLLLLGVACAAIVPVGLRAQAQGGTPRDLTELPADADPNDWTAHYDLGVSLLRRDPVSALELFRRASRIDPSRAEPLHGQWVAYWMSRSPDEFVFWTVGAGRMNPSEDVRIQDSIYALALQRNPFVHRGAEAILLDWVPRRMLMDRDSRAWMAYNTGNFAEAVRLHSIDLRRNPRDAVRLVDRAAARVMQRDLSGALADLEAALAVVQGEENRARQVTFYQSKHAMLQMIGLVRLQQGDLAGARTALADAMVEDAGFAYGQAWLGNISRAAGDVATAVQEYEFALVLAPSDPVIRLWYAEALFAAGRDDEAVLEGERVAAAAPEWAAPHLTVGRAHERRGRRDEALMSFAAFLERSARSDPEAPAVRARFAARD